MILNLSIDDQIVQKAREIAESRGMSVDQLVQDCLEDVISETDETEPELSVEEWIEEFRRLSGLGDSGGWKFNREELYDRGSKD